MAAGLAGAAFFAVVLLTVVLGVLFCGVALAGTAFLAAGVFTAGFFAGAAVFLAVATSTSSGIKRARVKSSCESSTGLGYVSISIPAGYFIPGSLAPTPAGGACPKERSVRGER